LAKTDQLPQNETEALKDLETTWTQQKEEQQQQLLTQLQQRSLTSAN
jgi:hypothetical protein